MPGGCRCCFLPLGTNSLPQMIPKPRSLEVGDCGVNEKLYGITLTIESTSRFTSLESQIVSLTFRIFSNMALSLFASSSLPSLPPHPSLFKSRLKVYLFYKSSFSLPTGLINSRIFRLCLLLNVFCPSFLSLQLLFILISCRLRWLLSAFERTLNYCIIIPTTPGSCSCHEHTTNLATGVSRQPVLDCGMIFHPDCGSRDFPSILSDDL